MRIKPGFELRDVCGENLIVAFGEENIDFSKVISLNESAALMWHTAEKGDFTPQILADALTAEYDVTPEIALRDAEQTLETWLKEGLVEI